MAQISNFEVPARLAFQPYRALWVVGTAEIVDWTDVVDWEEKPGSNALAKSISTSTPRGGDRVQVRVTRSTNTSGMLGLDGLTASSALEIERADIPSDVLLPHENRRNTPDISGREFDVLAYYSTELETPSPSLFLKPGNEEKDAWKLRDEFLTLKKDSWELSRFLSRWGLWNTERGYIVGLVERMPGFALVFPHLLWERREQYRNALTGKPRAWLNKAAHLSFVAISEPPYFLVQRFYCQEAIETTITIDHLSNVEFGICKLKDCRELFKRETRQKRLYCSPEHAHLANVRKLRAAKKKAEGKLKGAKRNAKG